MTQNIKTLVQEFQSLVSSKQFSSPKLQEILLNLKVETAQLNSLDPSQNSSNQQELLIAREFVELNVIYGLETNNIEEFNSAICRLLVLYDDYREILPKSSNYAQMVAINLLYLLSYNKIVEFHSAIELIPTIDLQNPNIKFVLNLESSLQEGNYKKMIQLKNQPTLPHFLIFLNRIQETIRYELARSAEKAYKNLSTSAAISLFHLNNEQELVQYCQQQEKHANDNGMKWVIQQNTLHFISINDSKPKINADFAIENMLKYAKEVERIV